MHGLIGELSVFTAVVAAVGIIILGEVEDIKQRRRRLEQLRRQRTAGGRGLPYGRR